MMVNEKIFAITPSGYQLILLEAWKRGLQLLIGKNGKFFVGNGDKNRHFQWTGLIGDDVLLARRIARNKRITKKFIALELGLTDNVPRWKSYNELPRWDVLEKHIEEIGFPLVLKKVNGSKGEGVFPELKNKEEVLLALESLKNNKDSEILLEEHVFGKDCRVYVVDGECVSVTHRIQPSVIGDGVSSILSLIEIRNFSLNGTGSGFVQIDDELLGFLKDQSKTLESIPEMGEMVFLSKKNNTSRGGMARDISDECPEDVKALAIAVVKGLPGVSHAGVDIIISDNPERVPVVLEINLAGEIGLQRFRKNGKLIPEKIISCYFPESKRIETRGEWYFDWEKYQRKKERYAEVDPIPDDRKFVWKKVSLDIVLDDDRKNRITDVALKAGVHGDVGVDKDGLVVVRAVGNESDVDELFFQLPYILEIDDSSFDGRVLDCQPWPSMIGFNVLKE